MTPRVFRFAPSPNGPLHLGHAYSALVNEDEARRAGGRLRLRIENIDLIRSRPEWERAILDDLDWLGLRFDAVSRQSDRIGRHAEALTALRGRRLAYPCFCSRGTLRDDALAAGTGRDPDGAPLYAGRCRRLPAAERDARLRAGEPHATRLDMARALVEIGGPLTVHTAGVALEGGEGPTEERACDPAAWGDVVIGRRDVPTSYHLAVVLDDAAEGVTDVVRGTDLLAATAVHRVLQTLLGLPAPLYRHHRLLLDETGRKLSKSRHSPSLGEWRRTGLTPQALRARLGFPLRGG